MSVRAMAAVWEIDLPDSDKIVLLALADCANDEGHCWPSVASLVRKCSKSERTIQGCIKRLVDEGHLTRREVVGKGCNYTVHPAQSPIPTGETHYLYRTENPTTGEFYIGARSCFGDPQADRYMGSGEWVKEQAEAGTALVKTIISTFGTREELGVAEQAATASVFGQPLCRNRKIATPETLSPRSRFAPQRTTQTPAAAADKPSRTINSEAKASSERVVARWKELAGKGIVVDVRVLDASRRQQLRLREKEVGLDGLLKAIDAIEQSKFLKGEGRDSKWKPDFDFLLQPQSLRRLIEGFYGQDEAAAPRKSPEEQRAFFLKNAEFFESIGRHDDAQESRRRAAMCGAPVGIGEIAQNLAKGVRAA